MGRTHKSHMLHATRTFSDTHQTNTKTSCTAPESKGVSPTQITTPSLSSHNLHAKPSHLRSSLNQRSSSPSPFFAVLRIWLRCGHANVGDIISSVQPFPLAKSHECGCEVFGTNATSIRSLSGEVPCCSVFDVGRAHRSFDVGPSMRTAATAFPATFAFFHSSTSALPSIRQSFLDSHFQPALHTETARLWRGGGLCIKLCTPEAPKCLKKVMLL